ncbi:hypothetical protein [Skermania piniformis]|uniref:Uncharacterized protein n=1 Tax=Skermania pinensis TaxID=39122 RepID=A0ABX8SAI1_9ACTN|nr:hypothetical protein [Skermania piniformis]QXQ14873.1 hypothetical protein KV203_05680 [Skermania piniformis]
MARINDQLVMQLVEDDTLGYLGVVFLEEETAAECVVPVDALPEFLAMVAGARDRGEPVTVGDPDAGEQSIVLAAADLKKVAAFGGYFARTIDQTTR